MKLKKLYTRPKSVQLFIKNKGHLKIIHIQICRRPIINAVENLLNLITLGKVQEIENKYHYDNLYHLYGIMTMSNNEKYLIEKNEIVQIILFKKHYKEGYECKESKVDNIIFNDAYLSMENKYGETLYHYTAYKYNCQDFLKKLANEIGVSNLNDFILQYVNDIFSSSSLRKLSDFVTNISGAYSRYILGKGDNIHKNKNQFNKPKKKIGRRRIYI